MEQAEIVNLHDLFCKHALLDLLRRLSREIIDQVQNNFLRRITIGAAGLSWLYIQHRVQKFGALATEVGNVCVGMHAKDFRAVLVRHTLNVFAYLRNPVMLGQEIGAALTKLVVGHMHDLWSLEDLENTEQQDTIKVISDVTTVVDFARHELESIPGDFFIIEQEVFQHRNRSRQVGVTELINDIPSEGAELAPLLDNGMEEA